MNLNALKLEAGPLRKFIEKAQDNYDIAINKDVLKPGLSPLELVTKETVTACGSVF